MSFKTTNLDLAAALQCHGHIGKVKRVHDTYAEFVFSDSKEVREIVSLFLVGDLQIGLAPFLYTRMAMKLESKKQNFIPVKVIPWDGEIRHPQEMRVGQTYWFIGAGQVWRQLWGSGDLHTARLRENNVFLTRQEAEKALAIISP